jgi:hypothetical protein
MLPKKQQAQARHEINVYGRHLTVYRRSMKTRNLPASSVKVVSDDTRRTYEHILCAPRRRNQVVQSNENAMAE